MSLKNKQLITKELIQKLQETLNTKQIADFFNVSRNTMASYIKKFNLQKNIYNQPHAKEIKDKAIELYELGIPANKIAKELNIDQWCINNWADKLNIKRSIFKHTYDYNIFSNIDSHEKAYWIGFIAADGNISSKDRNHLTKLIDFVKSDISIKDKQQKCNLSKHDKLFDISSAIFYSIDICNDLAKYGIVENKTFKINFGTNIPLEYKNSYLIGYLDGDGCITRNKNNLSMYILGNQQFIKSLEEYINTFNIKSNISLAPGTKNTYKLTLHNNKLLV